ncbi:MBL fold metallo-hydrolase [Aquimarina litoralis]|uniref:MBL fold metallo-hydrolase n=1 Tax=Aquimarina litoralis TaxID=584605 RepID=UPI001C599C10|nr:MBL fold metallo-hydrolase [Aquimarina litoralis]MBW1297762.1 MBL fold metallo-hydrolase [Aquimarina litoralis]
MKIHHIRNATMVIETNDKVILIDPMLSKKGAAGPSFTFFRYKPKRNPILNLPDNAMDIINKTTHCLLTHLHPDHLDKAAEQFLKSKNIPIICSVKDEKTLRKRGLHVSQVVDYWKASDFLGGTIEGIPAKHGYGFVAKPMGNVMGFYIQLPNEKTMYLSSDTIYTEDVDKVLKQYKPDISVVASGRAQLDIFKPLLMTMEDIVKFVKNSPDKVIANHLEAVNHCPITREELSSELTKKGLIDRTFIPQDGQVMVFE